MGINVQGLHSFLLEKGGIEISVDNDQIYYFVISIASGEMHYEEIVTWLRNKTKRI